MGFWREIGYHLVKIPVGHWVFAQASCQGIERGQGPMDGWMIVNRTVTRPSGLTVTQVWRLKR